MYLEGSDTAGQGDGGEGKVIKDRGMGDFSAGPGVKTLPSTAGGAGSILDRTKIPHASKMKKKKKKQDTATSLTICISKI